MPSDFAVAVRVLLVGGLGGEADAPEVERWRRRRPRAVHGVGEDGDAAGHQPDDELEHEDDALEMHGDDGRAGGAVAEEGPWSAGGHGYCGVSPWSARPRVLLLFGGGGNQRR